GAALPADVQRGRALPAGGHPPGAARRRRRRGLRPGVPALPRRSLPVDGCPRSPGGGAPHADLRGADRPPLPPGAAPRGHGPGGAPLFLRLISERRREFFAITDEPSLCRMLTPRGRGV